MENQVGDFLMTKSCILDTLKQQKDATKNKISQLEFFNETAQKTIKHLEEQVEEFKDRDLRRVTKLTDNHIKKIELEHQIKLLEQDVLHLEKENVRLLEKLSDMIQVENMYNEDFKKERSHTKYYTRKHERLLVLLEMPSLEPQK